ncbi:hypothetical protein GDO81_005724 [Engystomops pustulosus]|uniref:Uncharacterized protein n=1 Tax=Engystomops pustulosus TaxID=76066 RepID=A0AAV7CR81_ENGPU|nr:hypothetical protein GDO81_005724 [Engystomops pustulosus]
MLWRCPKLHLYWEKVLDRLTGLFSCTIVASVEVCILGSKIGVTGSKSGVNYVLKGLLMARKVILFNWKNKNPPNVQNWENRMDILLHAEQLDKKEVNQEMEKLRKVWLTRIPSP